jgi:hypothetical protein
MCPAWRLEDVARLGRLLMTPIKVALVTLLVGVGLYLLLQIAGPVPIATGPGPAGPLVVHSPSSAATEAELQERVDLFLSQFEDAGRPAASVGGSSLPPQDHP